MKITLFATTIASMMFSSATIQACEFPSPNLDPPVFDIYNSAQFDEAIASINVSHSKTVLVALTSNLHVIGIQDGGLFNFQGYDRKNPDPHFGIMIFDKNDVGKPAEFRIVAKNNGNWRTIILLPINPGFEEVKTGDQFDRADRENRSGFLTISVNSKYFIGFQRNIFHKLGLENRFSKSDSSSKNNIKIPKVIFQMITIIQYGFGTRENINLSPLKVKIVLSKNSSLVAIGDHASAFHKMWGRIFRFLSSSYACATVGRLQQLGAGLSPARRWPLSLPLAHPKFGRQPQRLRQCLEPPRHRLAIERRVALGEAEHQSPAVAPEAAGDEWLGGAAGEALAEA